MNRHDIEKNLELLGQELHKRSITGEIVIAGGAMMLLLVQNRPSTQDVDAYFLKEGPAIREAAQVVARRRRLPTHWLNDAMKGFFVSEPPVELWHDFVGLRVYMVMPAYLLAMKAMAGRPQDDRDLEALIQYLHITNAQEALTIIKQFIPEHLLTPRIQYFIEGLFDE